MKTEAPVPHQAIDRIAEIAKEAIRDRTELGKVTATICLHAEIVDDPRTGGKTKCYAVPLDDIQALQLVIMEIAGRDAP